MILPVGIMLATVIELAVIFLQSLLCRSEPKDPQDFEVASITRGVGVNMRYCTEIYAGTPPSANPKNSASGSGGEGKTSDGETIDYSEEKKGKGGNKKALVVDEVAAVGSNAAHVGI